MAVIVLFECTAHRVSLYTLHVGLLNRFQKEKYTENRFYISSSPSWRFTPMCDVGRADSLGKFGKKRKEDSQRKY
jgi:hypothetical protein